MEIHVSTVAFIFIVTVAACSATTTDSSTVETSTVQSTADSSSSDLTSASADSTSASASTDSQVSSTVASTTTTVTIRECHSHTCVGSNCLTGNITFVPKCNTTGLCYISIFRNGTTVTTVEAGCEVGTCSLTQVLGTAVSGEKNYTRCCSNNNCNDESLIVFPQNSGSFYLPSLLSIIALLFAQAFVNARDIC